MRISIAMTTYNGAKYLPAQLASFLAQTKQPDELVVCDDSSSDETINILRDFAARAPFNVRIQKNAVRLGWVDNFEKTMSLSRGDLIFFADQDDVWFRDKIAKMTALMAKNMQHMMAVNDAVLTDEHLNVTDLSLRRRFTSATGIKQNFYQGCCTVITRQFRDLCTPYPSNEKSQRVLAYDSWLNFVGTLLDVIAIQEEALQYYRRHGANASSSEAFKSRISPLHWLAYYAKTLRRYWRDGVAHTESLVERLRLVNVILDRLEQASASPNSFTLAGKVSSVRAARVKLEKRIAICSLPKRRRWAPGLVFLFSRGYPRSRGIKSFVVDMLK